MAFWDRWGRSSDSACSRPSTTRTRSNRSAARSTGRTRSLGNYGRTPNQHSQQRSSRNSWSFTALTIHSRFSDLKQILKVKFKIAQLWPRRQALMQLMTSQSLWWSSKHSRRAGPRANPLLIKRPRRLEKQLLWKPTQSSQRPQLLLIKHSHQQLISIYRRHRTCLKSYNERRNLVLTGTKNRTLLLFKASQTGWAKEQRRIRETCQRSNRLMVLLTIMTMILMI
jgi:hypothetical protein